MAKNIKKNTNNLPFLLSLQQIPQLYSDQRSDIDWAGGRGEEEAAGEPASAAAAVRASAAAAGAAVDSLVEAATVSTNEAAGAAAGPAATASDSGTATAPKGGSVVDLGFIHGFLASLSVILVSELGDKTFFIAAIMAMRHPRLVVFAGAIGALGLMTVLSG